MTDDLVRHLIVPGFGEAAGSTDTDAATLDLGGGATAFSTDAFVVQPIEFPGGSIGDLAVNGTVNDLASVGAIPRFISLAMVLEEGLDLEVLHRVASDVGAAATAAGVMVAAGDTKVVERSRGDGMWLVSAGVGTIPEGVDIGPHRICPGDRILVSGPLGRHGIAVMSCREHLSFNTSVTSDTQPLHELVQEMIRTVGSDLHALRDATRGGLAAVVSELVTTAEVGMVLDEAELPIPDDVAAACDLLGLDPLEVANEGVMVAVVAPASAAACLAAMRRLAAGGSAVEVGEVTVDHPGVVGLRTPLGATRIIDRPLGEQLPRIC